MVGVAVGAWERRVCLVEGELVEITLGRLGDDGRAEYAEGSVESAKSVW